MGVELGVDATLSEPFQSENSEALRQALCEAARLDPKDDANVEKALVQLSKEAPEKLKELMAMHCKSVSYNDGEMFCSRWARSCPSSRQTMENAQCAANARLNTQSCLALDVVLSPLQIVDP